MGSFVFVLGGVRSGKSGYAAKWAEEMGGEVTFIATAEPHDEEMTERIKRHKASRPKEWNLIEESKDVDERLSKISSSGTVLIDCLGLFVSNLIAAGFSDGEIEKKIENIINQISKNDLNAIIVSNDVGSGIVPLNSLARRFRDVIGFANQKCAANADKVIVMHAGVPVVIK
ncbi:MAG: bifunctional adenosylcobinamide kinase/adenosylcobinamide-phosphate guanylyltransferase [Candidatus Omnitrophica bacterium]|nr:bifunctional adenosylcobinamide kinase/adenosylcobinamide-phosphate guanylyltransferase [Candidatus Omnitrophota bacterium]